MKTGFDLVESGETPSLDENGKDFLRKSFSILKVLMMEATNTAAKYCEACGRTVITGEDTVSALQYEAHEFWNKPFEEDFFRYLEEERGHTYDTEDEEEESGEEEEEGEGEESEGEEEEEGEEGTKEEDEVYSDTLVSKEEELVRLHARIQEIKAGWDDWSPEDPVKSLVKRGVDAARQELHVS